MKNNSVLFGLAALLRQQLILHDGQLPLDVFVARLRAEPDIHVGNIDPTVLLRLLCAADNRFKFWPRHGVITLSGILPTDRYVPSDKATDKATETASLPHREGESEAQVTLLIRALTSIGRPTHVNEIVRRAAGLPSSAHIPDRTTALVRLLHPDAANEVISLGEGMFSLITWEAERAQETRPVLPICPRPWVDLAVFYGRFLESVFAGRERLADGPTASEFVARMMAWWGVDTAARLGVQQSIMAASYLMGLSPYAFLGGEDTHLRCDLPVMSLADTRRHCLRALTVRLAAMPQFRDTLRDNGPTRPKELARAFTPLHPYGLNDVEQRLHLLVALGAAERLSSGQFRLSPLGMTWVDERGQTEAPAAAIASPPKPAAPPAPPAIAPAAAEPVRLADCPESKDEVKAVDAASGTGSISAQEVAAVKKIRRCPALLPDKMGENQTFMDSVVYANQLLGSNLTTENFLKEMIIWAGREYPKSTIYYQNILDSYYVVGLLDRVQYTKGSQSRLYSKLAESRNIQEIRDIAIRSALDRLELGSKLLNTANQLQSFTTRDIEAALNTDAHDASYHIRLFVTLGLLSREGTHYRPTPIAGAYINNYPSASDIVGEVHVIHETSESWEYGEGLESFAYLNID